jgi:hypothetical protein
MFSNEHAKTSLRLTLCYDHHLGKWRLILGFSLITRKPLQITFYVQRRIFEQKNIQSVSAAITVIEKCAFQFSQ